METQTLFIQPETQERKPRRNYRKQFVRDPANKHVELPFFQERDLEILKEVHENRFLTASLVRELFPPMPVHEFDPNSQRQQKKKKRLVAQGIQNEGVGQLPWEFKPSEHPGQRLYRRLQNLYHFYYLQRLHTYRDEEIIYALDEKGAKRLREEGISVNHVEDWNEKNRDISQQYYKHTLMIARFYVALKIALRKYPNLTLKTFIRGKKACKVVWDTSIEGTRYAKPIFVDPDFAFVLHDHQRNGDYGFVCEADRSTKTLEDMLERYTRYALMFNDEAHLQKYKFKGLRVLTVCKSRERAMNLHGLPFRKDLARPYNSHVPKGFFIPEDDLPRFYFANEEDYFDAMQNVLASIWHRADEEWLRKDGSESTRGIIPDPLPLMNVL